ncbi:MAG: hypothetical protein K8S97_17175 [Anaerolineae bacterium]|nr:hypothetical protein [Anaerolineae bacterium]
MVNVRGFFAVTWECHFLSLFSTDYFLWGEHTMSDSTQLLRQAAALAKSGQRDEARRLIVQVLRTDNQNVTAWWGLANITSSVNERGMALKQVLRLHPDHEQARTMLEQLTADFPSDVYFEEQPLQPPPPQQYARQPTTSDAYSERPTDRSNDRDNEQRAFPSLLFVIGLLVLGLVFFAALNGMALLLPLLLLIGVVIGGLMIIVRERHHSHLNLSMIVAGVCVVLALIFIGGLLSDSDDSVGGGGTGSSSGGYDIVFSSTRDTSGLFNEYELYVMQEDGSNVRRLTHSAGDDHGAVVSNDGRRIVFVSERSKSNPGDCYVMDIDGSDPYELDDSCGGRAWSPDDRRVVFLQGFWPTDICFVDVNPNAERECFSTGLDMEWDVAWSPDDLIAVRTEDDEIYVMHTDGTQSRLLLEEARWLDWSPDGRHIAFSGTKSRGEGIWVANADGSNARQLTYNKDFVPQWSPDGRQIAFSSNRDGNGEVYVMNADGSNVRRLTVNTFSDWGPSWVPHSN